MIDIKNKLIFIHIPKTAGSSIEQVMREEMRDKLQAGSSPIPIQRRLRAFEKGRKTLSKSLQLGRYGLHSTLQHLKEK